ncbi:MAG: hypothetical protein ABR549_07650 [Mycobacteriales bacterium]
MSGLTYDTGALIAAANDDRRMWLLHRRALQRGVTPTVPAPVLLEAWRGEAVMARLLSGTEVEPLDGTSACAAGILLKRSGGNASVDASVVEGALRRGDAVVTSDRGHLTRLAAAVGRRLDIVDV